MSEVTVFGPDELAALLGAESLTVANPDPISVGEGRKRVVKYKSGELVLDAPAVADFLTIRGATEATENGSTRVFVVMEALAKRLAGLAPGPSPSDEATLLATLGSGEIDSIALPFVKKEARPAPAPGGTTETKPTALYLPDTDRITEDLGGVVRFPVSAFPGQRPRVRLLNGTSDRTDAQDLAPRAAALGGEVLLIGNGPTTDVAVSLVTYLSPDFESIAQRIADVLDVTAVRSEDLSDAADIDVVIGANYRP